MKHQQSYQNTPTISGSTTVDNFFSFSTQKDHFHISQQHNIPKTSNKIILTKTASKHFRKTISPPSNLQQIRASLLQNQPTSPTSSSNYIFNTTKHSQTGTIMLQDDTPNNNTNNNNNTSSYCPQIQSKITTNTQRIPTPKVIKLRKTRNKTTKYPSKTFNSVNAYFQPQFSVLEKEFNYYKKPHFTSITKTKNNNYLKLMQHSSLLIKPYKCHSNLLKQLLNINSNRIHRELKITITWLNKCLLWKEYTFILERIFKYYNNFKHISEKDTTINRSNFISYLRMLGLRQNIDKFTSDIFNIFHYTERSYDLIEFREMMYCLIVTNQHMNYNNKIEFICDILKTSDDNVILYKDVIRLIKSCLFYEKDIDKISYCFKQFFGTKEFAEKNDVCLYLMKGNEGLKKIFMRNLYINVKSMERYFNEEIMKIYHSNLSNSKYIITGRNISEQCNNDFIRIERCLSSVKFCEEQRKRNMKLNAKIFEDNNNCDYYYEMGGDNEM